MVAMFNAHWPELGFARTDAQGRSRPLHLSEAMACINFSGDFAPSGGRAPVSEADGAVLESLVECKEFTLHRAVLSRGLAARVEEY